MARRPALARAQRIAVLTSCTGARHLPSCVRRGQTVRLGEPRSGHLWGAWSARRVGAPPPAPGVLAAGPGPPPLSSGGRLAPAGGGGGAGQGVLGAAVARL